MREGIRRVLAATGLVLVLAVANGAVWHHEQTIARGIPMLLELAPVDPRSLMQGDYMALRFKLAESVRPADEAAHGALVIRPDARGVAQFVRLHRGEALASGEALLEYRIRRHTVRIVTDAWFFQEGQGAEYGKARFGELRVRADGVALLVALRGENLDLLGEERLPAGGAAPGGA